MIKINDKIELFGGYDYNPLFLKNPPAQSRTGKVIKFIPGQNKNTAIVIELDEEISGEKITGKYIVLETRYEDQNWQQNRPVHIELCDFFPEDKTWKERKQGEWIEATASYKILK
ncbi:hypothetical protein KAI92_01055 [Candidatus Parcubacteria bacterium]|nr:hypothetical protein [Candidatus Parcubacteria bacterium]